MLLNSKTERLILEAHVSLAESQSPNDQAFSSALAWLLNDWREGNAEFILTKIRIAANRNLVVSAMNFSKN